jgi:type IV pilus assembly protein PilY1
MRPNTPHLPGFLRRLVAAQVLGIYAAATLVPSSVFAAATPIPPPASLAQVPQFLQFPPAPNVFITVDNSGSMAQELLPDHGNGDNVTPERMFPMPLRTPYDVSGDGIPVTNLTAQDLRFTGFGHYINVARLRSSAHNLMYYDPRIRYRPWQTADAAGTISSLSDATNPAGGATTALYHPLFAARGGLDLAGSTITLGNYNVLEDTLVNSSGTYTARVDRTNAASALVPFALYYKFDTSRAGCDTSTPIASRDDLDCYERVEITPAINNYVIPAGNQRGENEPGCGLSAGVMVCNYNAEFLNFSNWFTYYRSRTLLARGAMGNAVAALGSGFRVGLGLINSATGQRTADGFTSTAVRLGVRDFIGASRKPFFDQLNNHEVTGITPSGSALMEVGKYFDWKTGAGNPVATGPWSNDPAAGLAEFASCRQSYHVYSTDGYWNERTDLSPFLTLASAAQDADTKMSPPSGDPAICRDGITPAGQPNCYRYDPAATGAASGALFTSFGAPGPNNLGNPNNRRFVSSESPSLADIAMYFWYRDLQPALLNNVTPSAANPAFWQNLSVISVALGLTGTVTDQGQPFLDQLDAGTASWPVRSANPPNGSVVETADDLWHAAVNSRGRLLAANNPQQLAAQLAAALQEIRARSAIGAAAASSTAFLDSGNGVFTSELSQGTWSGNLYRREIDPVTLNFKTTNAAGVPLPRDAMNVPYVWRASDQLAAPLSRKVFTMRSGSAPRDSLVEFLPNAGTSGVDAAQMLNLEGPNGQPATDVINYLRGDRTKELTANPPGTFRDRPRAQPGVPNSLNNVFGTFANSSPIFVRDEDFNLDFLPTGTPGRDTYLQYLRANQGNGTTPGRTPTIWAGSNEGMFHVFNADTGAELFAYVPRSVVPNLSQLVEPSYQHRFMVDGVSAVGDAFIGPPGGGTPAWRTVVVSSLGAGGRGVFAINATDPAALDASSVYWEVGPQSLAGTNLDLLGHTLGAAFVARVKDSGTADGGRWVAVFANGPESASKRAALFIVDLETGNPVRVLDTGNGDGANPNGLSTPAPLFDANRQLIGVYAGDLRGNVWKFDLSGAAPSSWNVAFSASPLFTTRSPGNVGPAATRGVAQPIFAKPLLRLHPDGGVMVLVGTGKLISPGDRESEDVQTFYGVWDKPGETVGVSGNFRSTGALVQQAITSKSGNPTTYFMTSFDVPYVAGKRGWFFDMGVTYSASGTAVDPGTASAVTVRERMITSPVALGQNILAQSFVPSVDSCDLTGLSFLFRLKYLNGSFVGTGSFGSPQSAAISMPGSFGLLPFIERLAAGQDPNSRTGVVFSIGLQGDLTGRRIDLGGLGAFRTWRQLLD